MPPVNELRWPILIGARAWASSAGAARFEASTAPAPAECFMNLRRENPFECNFVIAFLPWRRAVEPAVWENTTHWVRRIARGVSACLRPTIVMAGLVPAIHALSAALSTKQGVGARDKRGHDGIGRYQAT